MPRTGKGGWCLRAALHRRPGGSVATVVGTDLSAIYGICATVLNVGFSPHLGVGPSFFILENRRYSCG
jgi:hypothetical protein